MNPNFFKRFKIIKKKLKNLIPSKNLKVFSKIYRCFTKYIVNSLTNTYKNFKKAFNRFIDYVKYRNLDFFKVVEIETTTICNRKCKYCPNFKFDRGNHLMDEKLFKKIIDELSTFKFLKKLNPHFYGEPLLDTRLPNLIRYVRKKIPKVKITIYTNGDFLTIDLFNKLINAGLDYFIIDIKGQPGAKNLQQLVKYTTDKPSLRKKFEYRVITPETELMNRGGLVKPVNIRTMKKCRYPSDNMIIDYKGNVILCCNDYFSSIIFGNLNEDSILQIWNKSNYKRIREETRKGKYKLEICKKCVQLL
ncbi:MAG: radical SAM/SPASM domain-containing protein [Candidatus Helarchaeota archaeon]